MKIIFVLILVTWQAYSAFECQACLSTALSNKYCSYNLVKKCCTETDNSDVCQLGQCITPYTPKQEFDSRG